MRVLRPTDSDYTKIFELLDRAFAPSISESELVRKLKGHGKISFDFMIEKNGVPLAYICYSAAYDGNRVRIGYHLAPLAVLPEKQRQGLGKRIIRESLQEVGTGLPVYVLGDPGYYSRSGFRLDKTQRCSFDPDGGHFMVRFDGPLPPREVFYEDEFAI